MTGKPRLLFISASSGLYGAEQCLMETLKGLGQGEYDATVLVPKDGPLKARIESLGIPAIVFDLKWIGGDGRVLEGIRGLPGRVSKLMRLIDEKGIDLVFSNSSVVLDGALAAKLRRVPHVWHIHEGPLYGMKGNAKRLLRSLAVTMLSKRVITVSKGACEFFSLFGKGKFRTIYNGVEAAPLSVEESRADFRQEFGLDPGRPVAAMIGSILENKGQMDFIEAARIIEEKGMRISYLVVGSGNKAYTERLKERVRACGIEGSFRFAGFRPDVPYIMRNIDLFVLASRREPFGRVITEAMASAKPVVATRSGGPDEIVKDRVTGLLVPSSSPEALARAIEEILTLPDRGAQMGLRGREAAEGLFSLREYQRRIVETIDDALGSARPAGLKATLKANRPRRPGAY